MHGLCLWKMPVVPGIDSSSSLESKAFACMACALFHPDHPYLFPYTPPELIARLDSLDIHAFEDHYRLIEIP